MPDLPISALVILLMRAEPATWEGFSPWWGVVPGILLVGYALLRANYEHVRALERELAETRAALAALQARHAAEVSTSPSPRDPREPPPPDADQDRQRPGEARHPA